MKKMKQYVVAASAAASMLFFANTASAHVTVLPAESFTGAWETYTIKVPVEKDVPTTKVAVKMPAGVEFEQYETVPGWTTKVDKSGKGTTVTWSTEGEGIQAGQFQRFTFVAKNPDKAGDVAWDAYQYYKDGSIVEWTGDEDSDSPHSMTDIVKSTTSGHSHGGAMDSHGQVKSDEADDDHDDDSKLPLTLSIVGLVLAVVALITSLRRKK